MAAPRVLLSSKGDPATETSRSGQTSTLTPSEAPKGRRAHSDASQKGLGKTDCTIEAESRARVSGIIG